MTSIALQTKRLSALKKIAYFYCAWLALGFIGFGNAALSQDFYASFAALQLACVVGASLSLPILIPVLRNAKLPENAKARVKALGAYFGALILIPLVLAFFTYWWLPRLIHGFIGEAGTHTYTVISKNERSTVRGCNTHYWVRLYEWQNRSRENVCVTESMWATVRRDSHLSIVETVSLFGVTVHEVRNDG